MKKLFPLLLCLLLCGCARQTVPDESNVPAITVAAALPSETASVLEEARQSLEAQYGGTLQAYPLTQRKVRGIRAMHGDLVVFSGYGATTLTLLTGDNWQEIASTTLAFELDAQDPSLQISGRSLSYFDPVTRETVVLNEALKEVRRIAVTEDVTGSPILSADQNTLYYVTASAIRSWNLESGIHKTLKELSYEEQILVGLHGEGSLLQCQVISGGETRTLLLRTDNGQLVWEQEGDLTLDIRDGNFTASFPTALQTTLLFGDIQETPQALYPEDLNADYVFFTEDQTALTISALAEESVALDYYDLKTGTRQAELTLSPLHAPKSIVKGDGDSVYFLIYDPEFDCDALLHWDIPAPDAADDMIYTDTYRTEDALDYSGLARCRSLAAEIGRQYGINVLVWEDALAVQPWDYEFQAEYQAPVLMRELALLEERLSQFPEGMLTATAGHFTSLTICLVRQITGTAASGSLNTATGVQFFDGSGAYVAIAAGRYAEQALYHELFHVMETHILSESIAFDQWEALNPEGFAYTYDYSVPQNAQVYLSGEKRAFVDTYSMSFPKEDRARVWENALLPGREALFQSDIMQAKLTKLCQGIRQAYGLKKSPETFPWEQYLK